MFLAPPPPQVSMGAGLEAQQSGASWWGKADGQHPNLPVPSADIYLALTQSWALSRVLGLQSRILVLQAFLV